MKELESPKICEESEIERGLWLLAAEIARNGKAGDPETPAFIRRLLGVPITIEEPRETRPVLQAPNPPSGEVYLRVKKASDGTNRYELVFPPKNDVLLVAWGRLWRRVGRIRPRIAAFLQEEEVSQVALPPVASRRQLPAAH